jgi:cytochrome c oxidase assembly factor CtaG
MFVFYMLLAIAGMAMLICVLIFFIYKILRDKKNGYSWFSLIIIVFFLGLAIWQSLYSFNIRL